MIVGVDHLALSCDDVDAAGVLLRASGYREAFVERDLPNSEVKGPFVHELHATHSIAYYEADGGTPVELTNYGGPVSDAPAHYSALVAAPTGESAAGDGWGAVWEAAGYGRAAAYEWPGLGATVWAVEDAGAPAVRAVLSPAHDVDRATGFWRDAVGLRLAAEGSTENRRWARVELAGPVPGWGLGLVVAEGAPRPDARLDDRGFACLGLLCTSLERDGARLLAGGAVETSGRFDVTVHGRPLAVAFFRGPDGELIELIEVRRNVG